MKVAFDLRFVRRDRPSGLYTYSLELARGLGRVAPDLRLGLVVPPDFSDESVRGVQFTSGAGFLSLWQHAAFTISKPWGKWQPDIYHYSHFNAPACGKAALVSTIHDLYPMIPGYCNGAFKQYFLRSINSTLRRSRKVICVSNFTLGEVARNFPAYTDKLVMIGEAARTTLHVPTRAEVEEVRQRFNLPNNFVLYIGNAKPHKNLPRLIRAYAKLPAALRNQHHLVLAGNPHGFRDAGLERLALSLGIEKYLHLPGAVGEEDISAFYHSARVYAQVSLMETFGLPVAEAQALGVPCLISYANALPQTGGSAAVIVNPEDEEEISEHLRLLLSDNILRDSLINRGLALSKERTWDGVARQVAELYKQVLGEV
jgi:glycosyltransferase involved in cell wall biosynthesis